LVLWVRTPPPPPPPFYVLHVKAISSALVMKLGVWWNLMSWEDMYHFV
jgi:hypothetical protein